MQVQDLAQGSKTRAKLVGNFIDRAVNSKKLALTIFRASNDQVVRESEVDEPIVGEPSAQYQKEVLVGDHSGCVQNLLADSDNIKMLVHWANGERLNAAYILDLAKRGKPVSVFVSRPTTLNRRQELFIEKLEKVLSNYGLKPRTLGLTDSQKADGGMYDVIELMRDCSGALVLGFSQIQVDNVTFKGGTKRISKKKQCEFVTPWNHMEACMAFAERLPLLIIKEEKVWSDGVFDKSCLRLVPQTTDLEPAWLDDQRFRNAMDGWVEQIARTMEARHRL